MKSAFKLLPRGFTSLLDYISPSAFEVIEWKAALAKSGGITKEILFKSSLAKVKKELTTHLPPAIDFSKGSKSKNEKDNFDRKKIGHNVLTLYFCQLFLDESKPLFLDLRPEHFSVQSIDGELSWAPSGLWTHFSKDFKWGLKKVYQGFYHSSEEALEEGLESLGLTPTHLTAEHKHELRGLLEKQFGEGKDKPIEFRLSDFMQSFDSLFVFLKNRKIRLSEDFLFLGVYLVTLYIHLESLETPLDVAAAFKEAERLTL